MSIITINVILTFVRLWCKFLIKRSFFTSQIILIKETYFFEIENTLHYLKPWSNKYKFKTYICGATISV